MEAWQKGESGNPFGNRSRYMPKVNAFRTICQEYSKETFELLWELVQNRLTHELVRFQAMKFILEHAYGKAPQCMEVKSEESIAPNMMSSEQLRLAAANKTKELVFSLIESGKIEEYIRAYKEDPDINSNEEASSINDKDVIEGSFQKCLEKIPV